MQFTANVIIQGKIRCETGLHIGGTMEGFEIGGMDNPVLRDPSTGYPYIPGSSIKGKMRSIMEWATGKITVINDPQSKRVSGDVHSFSDCHDHFCPICRIYGTSAAAKGWKSGPARLVVRDAFITTDEDLTEKEKKEGKKSTKEKMDLLESEQGLPKVEWKTENSINRITSAANPRPMERVTAGSEFMFEMVYSIYDTGDGGKTDKDNLKEVFKALRILEDSALGGGGSRGNGQISFLIADEPIVRKLADYEKELAEGKPKTYITLAKIKVDEIIAKLDGGEG